MHYIPLQERSSQRDRADELRLLTWLGGDENGIDEKAVVDFKRIYCRHEVRALLWQKVGTTSHVMPACLSSERLIIWRWAQCRSWKQRSETHPLPPVGGSWRASKPAPLQGTCWIKGWKGPAGRTSPPACWQGGIHSSLKTRGNRLSLHYAPCWFSLP